MSSFSNKVPIKGLGIVIRAGIPSLRIAQNTQQFCLWMGRRSPRKRKKKELTAPRQKKTSHFHKPYSRVVNVSIFDFLFLRKEGGVRGKQHISLFALEGISNVKLVKSVTLRSPEVCMSHEVIKFSLYLKGIFFFLPTDIHYDHSELNILKAHTRSSSQPVLTLGVENGACQQAFERDGEVKHDSRGQSLSIGCLVESFNSTQPQLSLS